MMYPFMTLDDQTEIVHSELYGDGTVRVYIEKPDAEDGFYSAYCQLPGYQWTDIVGFDDAELDRYQEILESTAHLILRFAEENSK